jgi:hypothetical protein
MFLPFVVTLSTLLTDARDRLNDRLARSEAEGGFTTLEWAVIGSIAFAMAVAIGAGLTAVANNYLGKIGG